MSIPKGSRTSNVKTWKLQHGVISVEVTAGVLKDKPKAKKTSSSAGGKPTKRKKK